MIDKSLVKKRFTRSLSTYSENAIVQKQMAKMLINLLPYKHFNSILEIGCYSGILTEKIINKLNYKSIDINDIVADTRKYIDKLIHNYNFLEGDIEEIKLKNNYDLIISNACLQWCNNTNETAKKLFGHLNINGVFAFSIFGKNNLKEIYDILGFKQTPFDINILKSEYKNIKIKEEEIKTYFNTPLEVLKHLKYTGANSLKEHKFTRTSLKDFELQYLNNYSENGKVYLTYNPVYIVIEKITQ